MKILLVLSFLLICTACAIGPQPYWESPAGMAANRQQDDLECSALAAQAASGAGDWSSDRAIRAGIYQHARQNYYNQCVQSRGYRWVTPR
jgi:hypothetical protein